MYAYTKPHKTHRSRHHTEAHSPLYRRTACKIPDPRLREKVQGRSIERVAHFGYARPSRLPHRPLRNSPSRLSKQDLHTSNSSDLAPCSGCFRRTTTGSGHQKSRSPFPEPKSVPKIGTTLIRKRWDPSGGHRFWHQIGFHFWGKFQKKSPKKARKKGPRMSDSAISSRPSAPTTAPPLPADSGIHGHIIREPELASRNRGQDMRGDRPPRQTSRTKAI